jgi:hypothetical protein
MVIDSSGAAALWRQVTQGENYFTLSHLLSLSILFCVLALTSVIWSTNSAPLFAVAISPSSSPARRGRGR